MHGLDDPCCTRPPARCVWPLEPDGPAVRPDEALHVPAYASLASASTQPPPRDRAGWLHDGRPAERFALLPRDAAAADKPIVVRVTYPVPAPRMGRPLRPAARAHFPRRRHDRGHTRPRQGRPQVHRSRLRRSTLSRDGFSPTALSDRKAAQRAGFAGPRSASESGSADVRQRLFRAGRAAPRLASRSGLWMR